MLPSCSSATVKNFTEFAENLEMCTTKLEKLLISTCDTVPVKEDKMETSDFTECKEY